MHIFYKYGDEIQKNLPFCHSHSIMRESSILWQRFPIKTLGNDSLQQSGIQNLFSRWQVPAKNLFLFFILLVFAAGQLQAQFIDYNHPELQWKTFETEHFIVHFPVGAQRTALEVSKIAEEIYPHVTGIYNYEPAKKIQFVIRDTDDYSNGGAYFLDDKVEIWASNLDYILRGTTNWLRNVVTHEFTHMISIQKMIKSNLTFPFGFLQYISYEKEKRKDVVRGFPSTVMVYPVSSIILPVWFAEGTAQHQVNGSRYDYRDPHREMILRDRVLHNNLLSYNAMSVFGKGSNGNESSYNQGFSFINYLSRRFGEHILSDITRQASKWDEFTFESAFKSAVHFPVNSMYAAWKDSLQKTYTAQTALIRKNLHTGVPVEQEGSANLYPIWSPDGKKIAFVSNKGEDYISKNSLVLYDPQSGNKEKLASGITSSLSWSPDGRWIAYARQERNRHHSSFDDLFLYNLQQKKEIRLTENMRAKNPDFSYDGKQLTFVTAANGLTQLNVLGLPDSISEEMNGRAWFNRETGEMSRKEMPEGPLWRRAQFAGNTIRQLLAFQNGRQIFHPRWSGGDSLIVFDTAVEYGRNLGVYNLKSKTFKLFMEAEEELRYPFFQPGSPWLYYASSTTGIYNIYRRNLQTGVRELLTNVTGGAMMPAVNRQGNLVYALYDSSGYQIYKMDQPRPVNPAAAVYDPQYIAHIPPKNFSNVLDSIPEIHDYKQMFTDMHILPRLWVDYGTFKPGFFVTSSDVLNKYNLTAGVAANSDFDYDLYGYFEVKETEPTLFLEAYNISQTIKGDTVQVSRSDQGVNSLIYNSDIRFNLAEVHAGLTMRLFDMVDLKAAYIWRNYGAKISQNKYYSTLLGKWTPAHGTFHYTYLKGHALEWSLTANHPHADRNRDINPSGGYYLHFVHSLEYNEFLKNLVLSYINAENFQTYVFNRVELDVEKYFRNPLFPSHSIALRWRGGLIDRKTNDFFNLYAGGLIGMKGYSYFSIEGRYKSILTLTYRFPLWQHMDLRLGNLSLDKLYFGVFYDWGNAWNSNRTLQLNDFKRDVGMQLRMDAFSYSLFPTRFFAEAVYPLDSAQNFDGSRGYTITYPRKWRYYFGLLYAFDLRERMGSLLRRIR